jgi:hypothetical protein
MLKRNSGASMVILVIIAAAGIAKVAGTVRPVDIVQLTGSGACIGVAFVMAFMRFRVSRGE